jgi:hypothetical protein
MIGCERMSVWLTWDTREALGGEHDERLCERLGQDGRQVGVYCVRPMIRRGRPKVDKERTNVERCRFQSGLEPNRNSNSNNDKKGRSKSVRNGGTIITRNLLDQHSRAHVHKPKPKSEGACEHQT